MNLSLLLGPVGAGKTTFGMGLAKKESALFLNLDEWMTNLFKADRPSENIIEWYINRAERCKNQILNIAERSISNKVNVVLEIGLLRKTEREYFFNWCEDRNINLKIYIFEVERSVRRERVLKRNIEKGPSFSMEVPMEFFELASDHWEEVDSVELQGKNHVVL